VEIADDSYFSVATPTLGYAIGSVIGLPPSDSIVILAPARLHAADYRPASAAAAFAARCLCNAVTPFGFVRAQPPRTISTLAP
jgi:hypothetical protein